MLKSANIPHIYYTVSELSTLTDIWLLKNVNIKTVAFIAETRAYDFEYNGHSVEKTNIFIELDFLYNNTSINEYKLFLIAGLLYMVNQRPIICVKYLRELDEETNKIILYHNQSLMIRKRSRYFQNLSKEDSATSSTSEW